uniref:General transcription factor IIIC, polypeptide 3 n=1 Tax=Sinocyclocheilus anshuiensis TaxID=1608454 RepID=A0A671M4Y2_9TELE
MSELNDYLEGKITFEDFERRREESKAKDKVILHCFYSVCTFGPRSPFSIYKNPCNMCLIMQSIIMIYPLTHYLDMPYSNPTDDDNDDDDDEEEGDNDRNEVTPGDVFALEMELNHENKKMMERRHRSKLPRALRGLMGEANIRCARGDKEDAILMCMEIIRQAPVAYEPFSTLAMIYEDQGDMEKALQFGLIAAHLNPSDWEEWVKLADMSLEQDNIKQAIICYTKVIKYDPSNVQYLWERSSLYEQVGEHKQSTNCKILEVVIPDDVPVDIRVKMMVCLIHQHVIKPLDPMLTSDGAEPGGVGRFVFGRGRGFYEEGEYKSALPLLSTLVCSERYNLAVVWLRHAECLKALGHLEVAVKSYSKVVEMAPLHLDACLALSTLQQQLGRPNMALEALEPMYDTETLAQDSSAAQQELKLLLHRSTLLHAQGRTVDYIDTVFTMLSMLLKVAMVRAQVCVISDTSSGVKHLKLISVTLSGCKTSVLSRDDWWKLLLRCLAVLCEVKHFAEAELLADSTLEYYSFYDDRVKRKELEYLSLSAAFLDRNFRKAYDYIRLMLMDNVDRTQLWNVFNQVTLHSQDARHHRFCLRLMLKHPHNHALYLLNGHTSLVSGTFKHALGQYMQAFRNQPDHPLHSLVVGLTFFHMACQRFVMKRHPLIVQGFSFLWHYVDLRGHCQESLYNIGRALHQLGLSHLAIHYYEKALTLPPLKLEGIDDDQVDLRREIAYNLSLIYQSSGNKEMARHVIYTLLYCLTQ